MTFKEFFSLKRNKLFWGNIIAMIVVVVALVMGTLKWLDAYTHHGEAVVVPDVKGMRVAEAQKIFEGKGLECTVSDSTYVKTLPAGSILDYAPTMGQRVKKGRTVYLTINTLNVPLCNVPDVADNSSVREAQARLLAAGFKLTPNDSVPGEQDWVYYVRHGEDTLAVDDQVPTGATLTLIIGNGEPIPVPTDSLATDSLGLMRDSIVTDLPEDESWF